MYNGYRRHKSCIKMCSVLPTWCNDLQQKLNTSSPIPKYFRLVCICTATSAFVLGIVIGLLIPIYLLPSFITSSTIITHGSTLNISSGPISSSSGPLSSTSDGTRSSTSGTLSMISNGPLSTSDNKSVPHIAFDSVSFVPAKQDELILDTRQSVNSSWIQDGIYWSPKVESMLPYGYDSTSAADWRRFVRQSKVVKVEEGCGRMQNRLLTFDNGTLSCCRYRQNIDQIQGEIFSFYLGRYVLDLPNLTPATLSRVKPQTRQWSSVKSQLSVAQWATEDRAVVMTKFIPDLGPAYIPTYFRSSERRLHPPDLTTEIDPVDLAQWSDLIIFDYLTANLDRVVNNLYNLQWNPTMMDSPAHNLARDTNSGLLLFLDNESGLLHGYRLLDKYEHYHRAMLDSLCVFRKSTANAIKRLFEKNNIGELLRTSFKSSDPEFVDILPVLPEKSVKILNKRIARVYDQITRCEAMFK